MELNNNRQYNFCIAKFNCRRYKVTDIKGIDFGLNNIHQYNFCMN